MRFIISNLAIALASNLAWANLAWANLAAGFVPQIDAGHVRYEIGDGLTSIALIDLNRDQRAELIVINRYTNSVSVLINTDNGKFSLKARHSTGLTPVCLAAGDFNRDGTPDFVVANSGSDTISILFGSPDATLDRRTDYKTGTVPCAVAVGDLNRDGYSDLAVLNRYGNSVSVFLGKGDGRFSSKVDYDAGRLPYSVAISDVSQDGKPDILVSSCFEHTIAMLAGFGDGTFHAKVRKARAEKSCSLLIDVDGDGRPDLTEAHRYGYLVSVQFARDFDNPAGRSVYIGGKGPSSLLAADFNGDGIRDLAVANSGHYRGEAGSVAVLIGQRSGAFLLKNSYVTGSRSHSLAAADVNGDGKLDLAVVNGSYDFGGSVSMMLGKGDGTFAERVDYATGGYVVWVSFSEDAGASTREIVWLENRP